MIVMSVLGIIIIFNFCILIFIIIIAISMMSTREGTEGTVVACEHLNRQDCCDDELFCRH